MPRLSEDDFRESVIYYVGYCVTRQEEAKFKLDGTPGAGQLEAYLLASAKLELLANHFVLRGGKVSKTKALGKMTTAEMRKAVKSILEDCRIQLLERARGILNTGELNSTSATVRYLASVRFWARAQFIKEWEGKV